MTRLGSFVNPDCFDFMFCRRCGNLMMFVEGNFQCVVRECDMRGVKQVPEGSG